MDTNKYVNTFVLRPTGWPAMSDTLSEVRGASVAACLSHMIYDLKAECRTTWLKEGVWGGGGQLHIPTKHQNRGNDVNSTMKTIRWEGGGGGGSQAATRKFTIEDRRCRNN